MFYSTKVREEIRGNSTGKKVQEKKYGKKYGKNYGEQITGQKVRPDRTSSGHVTLSLPVKKAPLGRILRNFRLRMRRTKSGTISCLM
jgi:hypothetical protein